MNISRSHFPLELVKIIQLIADSHFVAVDLEFSGIAGRRKDRKKPTLQEVYEEVKDAAEKYQVLQVGLTVVHEDLVTGRIPENSDIINRSYLPPCHPDYMPALDLILIPGVKCRLNVVFLNYGLLFSGSYIARPYNFNINPIPASEKLYIERVWSFQSGGNSTQLRGPVPACHSLPLSRSRHTN
jgi:hypothetical protein